VVVVENHSEGGDMLPPCQLGVGCSLGIHTEISCLRPIKNAHSIPTGNNTMRYRALLWVLYVVLNVDYIGVKMRSTMSSSLD